MAGRYFGSLNADLDVNYQFELYTIDENNKLRKPVSNHDGSFTFEGAVENFQARFEAEGVEADGSDSQVVNITNLFADRDLGETDEDFTSVTPGLEEPLTLDLTTRFVDADVDPDVNVDRIEYTIDIDGNELLANELGALGGSTEGGGVTELTLFIEDASNAPGFQIDANGDGQTDFEISGGQATGSALNDIKFIDDNDLLASITGVSYGEDSLFDPNTGINRGGIDIPERLIIEDDAPGNNHTGTGDRAIYEPFAMIGIANDDDHLFMMEEADFI
ncbi:MAG: hypothetical protein QNJ53_14200 [Pleurocapsa sp. MO_192.B19]|nr:hypothetical protein [Pleurocapsa sp. MO_192.B19]